jgi:hypothetical protein
MMKLFRSPPLLRSSCAYIGRPWRPALCNLTQVFTSRVNALARLQRKPLAGVAPRLANCSIGVVC